MELTIEMPVVRGCTVDRCAYNRDARCNAKAITIGDGTHPGCDTFIDVDTAPPAVDESTGVGACKVTACRHNSDLACTANGIQVEPRRQSPNCVTFAPA
jgi:hypothetical protein